jgi:hypothetical protein
MADYRITDTFVREWNRIRAKVDGMRGEGVYNEPASIAIRSAQDGGRGLPPAASPFRWVKVTGALGGGGKYTGRMITFGASAPNLTSTVAETDFGTIPTADDCYILNAAEVGKLTHDLTNGTPVTKMFIGMLTGYTHTDGKPFIRITGLDWETCA